MFQQWLNSLNLNTANARHIDDDADGSFDCVDVPEDWCKFLWPGISVGQTLGFGNAKDHYASASGDYFDKLPSSIIAQPGDIPVWGATATNPYGHIAVTISDDGTNLMVVEQNTYTQEAATVAHRTHNNLIGFLRPKKMESNMQTFTAEPISPELISQHYANYTNGHVQVQPTDPACQNRFGLNDENWGGEFWRGLNNQQLDIIKAGDQKISDLETQLAAAQQAPAQSASAVEADTNSKVTSIWNLLSKIFIGVK